MNAIFHATERGAALTNRLLAFGQRQTLIAKPLCLESLLDDIEMMIRRTIGEDIGVEITVLEDCWPVCVDAGQLETALLNLALNARDAMPDGGVLQIRCANVVFDADVQIGDPECPLGEYVEISVTDNGNGMSPEVLKQAFEPFFTTREIGVGSGLGLSVVHGFVKQSGGHTEIHSDVGHGTTVTLYMPRSNTLRQVDGDTWKSEPRSGRGKTVLLVEQNPDMRAMVNKMLENQGYRIIAVPEAAAAQEILSGGGTVDVILSDAVLSGGISGPEFVKRARAVYPNLKTVFMSGFPADAGNDNDLLDANTVFLGKPFRRNQLIRALREILNDWPR